METTCPVCGSEKRIKSKFCSVSCANTTRKWTDEQKKKISESVKITVSKKFSSVDVECKKCGKKESIQVFEGSNPPDQFYCSMKCSKSRDHSEETVEKIRKSVQLFFEKEGPQEEKGHVATVEASSLRRRRRRSTVQDHAPQRVQCHPWKPVSDQGQGC